MNDILLFNPMLIKPKRSKSTANVDQDHNDIAIISDIINTFIHIGSSLLEIKLKPRVHYKCRFDENDASCSSNKLYTRTKDVERFPVPCDKISWDTSYDEYSPKNFTAEKIKNRKIGDYKEPDVCDENFDQLNFNVEPKTSHCGKYKVEFSNSFKKLVPLNPIGRTGLIGRGHLGKWAVNHAADPIVTRWKRDENGNKIIHPQTNRPILQFVAVQRKDTKEFAIPGGMVEPKEFAQVTCAREFAEEALSKEFEFISQRINQKIYSIVTEKTLFDKKYNHFFLNGKEIYRGYVDDPRNTDNAWMETIVYNFHDETDEFVGSLKLEAGDEVEGSKWIDIDSSLKLFASHSSFIHEVAKLHKSHW